MWPFPGDLTKEKQQQQQQQQQQRFSKRVRKKIKK